MVKESEKSEDVNNSTCVNSEVRILGDGWQYPLCVLSWATAWTGGQGGLWVKECGC